MVEPEGDWLLFVGLNVNSRDCRRRGGCARSGYCMYRGNIADGGLCAVLWLVGGGLRGGCFLLYIERVLKL